MRKALERVTHLQERTSSSVPLAFFAFMLVQLLTYASPVYGQGGSGSSHLKWLYAGKFGLPATNELQCDTLIVTQLIPAIVKVLPNGFMRDAFKRDSSGDVAASQAESYALLRDAALANPTDIANAQVAYTTMYLMFAEKWFYIDEDRAPIALSATRIVSLERFKIALQEMGFDISSFAHLTHEKVYVLNTPLFSFQWHTKNGVVFVNDDQEMFLREHLDFQESGDETVCNELFHSAAQLWYIAFAPKDPVWPDSLFLSTIEYMDVEEFGSVVTTMLVSANKQQTLTEFLFLRIANGDFVSPTTLEGNAGYYGSTLLLKEICTDLGIRKDVEAVQKERSTQRATLATDKMLITRLQNIVAKVEDTRIKTAFLDMWQELVQIY